MTLPDASRLLDLDPAAWRSFGRRLGEIGFNPGFLGAVGLTRTLRVSVRDPARVWQLRRREGHAALAARMFTFGDAVPDVDARAALGGALVDALLGAGFLVKSDSGVASPFHTQFVQGVLVAADELAQGEDAVMGAGSTTGELFAAGLPRRRLGSMLDLGCGAGACALAMAAHADRVVGTDINPRAIVLGRMNAMLNGIANAEFREGDLFAPVEGERFDLILSQPPFVAMPDGATARTYLYGGRRGDELPLRVIAQAPAYLAETGRAIVLVDFPLPDGEGVCAIVSSALAGRANAVLVQQEHDADTDAIACAASQFPELGAEFAAAVVARREHFARMGVDRLALTFTVLERPRGPETWVAATPLFWRDEQHLGAPWLDALFAAHELVARGPDAILAARLHAPEGARFVEGEDGAVDVAFPADRPVESVELTRDAYDLVATLQESESVRHAFATLAAKQESATPEEAAEVLLPVVVEMLQRGVLEVD